MHGDSLKASCLSACGEDLLVIPAHLSCRLTALCCSASGRVAAAPEISGGLYCNDPSKRGILEHFWLSL